MREVWSLTRSAATLLVTRLPFVAFWVLVGWIAREVCTFGAVLLGAQRVPALLLFALGLVAWVAGLVLAIRAALPPVLATSDSGLEVRSVRAVLVGAVAPFMVVISAWGYTEQHVRRAFVMNSAQYGSAWDNFSISFASWQLYLVIAIVCWVVQAVIGWIVRSEDNVVVAAVTVILRGVSLLTAFLGVDSAVTLLWGWLQGRVFWRWGEDLWFGLLDVLPDWHLPWHLTLPESLQWVADVITQQLLPGAWNAILLPLVWLALVAIVVGHDGSPSGWAKTWGERLRSGRIGRRVTETDVTSPLGVLRGIGSSLVEDLVPVLTALRLLLGSGPVVVGSILLLNAIALAIPDWITRALVVAAGPRTWGESVAQAPFFQLAGDVIGWTIIACVTVAGFRRILDTHAVAAPVSEPAVSPAVA